jgi:hypothetical protein
MRPVLLGQERKIVNTDARFGEVGRLVAIGAGDESFCSRRRDQKPTST